MCLLIAQNKNSKVSNKKLGVAWSRNHDGVGYAFCKNGKITVRKFMEFKPFKNSFNTDVKKYGSESSFLIHFRFATHGKTDLTNVHPFKINDNLVFGHNGVINEVKTDNKLSDTQVFNNIILKNLDVKFLESETLRFLIESFIGSSKLVFLDNYGKIDIINEGLGHWSEDKNIWFSNDGYKKQKTYFINGGRWNGIDNKWINNSMTNNQFSFKEEPKKELANNKLIKCTSCDMDTDVIYHKNSRKLCEYCFAESDYIYS